MFRLINHHSVSEQIGSFFVQNVSLEIWKYFFSRCVGANELGSVSSRGVGVSMRPWFSPPRDTYGSIETELRVQSAAIKGSLSNVDVNVNENGKNATGLDKQNNNFVHASRFFVHFFVVTARKT